MTGLYQQQVKSRFSKSQ